MGFARAQPILRATATGCSCAVASPLNSSADKKKTPVGSGRFRSQLGGSWGLLISTWRLWGAGKEPREFRKFLLLADQRIGRAGDRDRLAGLHHARGLGIAVVRGARRDAE